MSPIRVALLCLVSLATLPVSQLYAQGGGAPPAVDQVPGRVVLEPSQDMLGTATYSGGAPVGPFGGYLFFRKDIGQGVGYDDGYTNVGWFQPMQLVENGILFGQAQFFVTDAGEWGGNLGGGYRHYFASIDRLVGAYGFYDADESSRGINYDQLSIGFETLGRRWDFRANGYFPLEKDVTMLGIAGGFGGIPSFVGNNLLFNGSAYFEKAMPGADAEFGLPIFDPSAFGRLRAYFGAYVYDSEEKNPAGVRVRLESHLNQYFTVGAAFLHDDIHGGQATIAVDVRSWSKKLPPITNYQPTQEPKLYLPVVRQNRVATHTFVDEFSAFALGDDGQELDFVWVDNSNPNAGDGTFENPFHDMPGSAPGADYILVRHGDSSLNNPVLGGIVLENGQTMFGEGFRFGIPVAGTKFGIQPLGGVYNIDTILPEWDRSGNYPFISNPGGNVITLASDNTVGGFNIISSAGHGITGANINNFELFRLNIGNANPAFGNGGAAIALTNASGVGTIDDFTFLNNAGGGLIINNTSTAPLTLTLTPSTTVAPNVVGGATALGLFANNSTITATFQDYLATGTGNGMTLSASNGGLLNVTGTDSTFDNTTVGDGVQVFASNNSTVLVDLFDTTANNAARHGLNVAVSGGSRVTGVFDGSSLGGSSFSDAGQMGVRLTADGSPNALNSLVFNNTTVNNSGTDGLHAELTNGSFFDVQFQDGQINNSGGNGIATLLNGSSTLDLAVSDTPITPSGLNGFLFDAQNNSVLNATFTDVNLSLADLNGIVGTLDTGATANVSLTDALVDQSGEHGLFLTALGGSTFNGTFDTVSLSDSNQSGGAFDGINTVVDGVGTVVNIDMVDTQVDNTMGGGGQQQNALDFLVDNGGELNFTIANSGIFMSTPSSMLNSDQDGVLGRVHNSGLANVTFDGTPIDNSGSAAGHDGLDLLVDSMGALNVSLLNGSSASDSAGNGILFVANDAGTSGLLTVDDSTVDDNGLRGIDLLVDTGASLTAEILNGSSVSDNTLDGIRMAAHDAGTDGNLTVDGSTVDDNGGDGIDLLADTGATLTAEVLNMSSVSGNLFNGILATATNAGTTLDLTVEDSAVDNNILGSGILMDVTDDAELIADLSGSASGNAVDGVNLLVDGTLGTPVANVTVGALLADTNGDDGFDFTVQQGGELNLDFTGGASGSGNQDNGFVLNATDAGTIARLDMNGANAFDDNVNGFGALVNASGIAELQAMVSGSASDNALDGIQINVVDIANVDQVGVRGPGAINNNGGNGITIDIDNSTVDEILIDAFVGALNVSNNTGDGALINIHSNSAVAELNVLGPAMSNNGGRGIAVIGNASQLDTVLFDGATVNNSQGGDGILFQMSNMTADILSASFNNGGSASNQGNGLNIDLDGTPIQVLNINGNTVGGVGGLVGLDFLIVGPTNPGFGGGGNPTGVFRIENTSPSLDVTGFLFDITNSNAGPNPVFDTLDSQLGFKFLPFGGTDATTGLATINGVAVVPPIIDGPGQDETMDSIGTVLLGGGIPNNTAVMDLTFIDFNPGEAFQWDIDVDPAPNNDQGINGNQLAGAEITVNFAGGLFIAGSLVQIGPNSSNFVATTGNIASPGFSENLLDGVRINTRNGSDIGALSIDNNTIDNNGQGGAGHGVNFLISNSTLPGPGAGVISNNVITNHAAGDGVRLVLPDTDGNAIGMDFTDNTITDNTGGMGVNLELDANAAQAGTASTFNFDGNDISRNGSFGVRLGASDTVEYELNFGQTPGAVQNTLDANADAGIAIDATDNTIGSAAIANTAVTNTIDGADLAFGGEGLAIHTRLNAQLAPLTIGDPLAMNTMFDGNASHGIHLRAIENSVVNNTLIQNTTASGNGGHGIAIERLDNVDLGIVTIDTVTASGNTLNGLDVLVSNATLPVAEFNIFDSVFDENAIGMNFAANADAVLLVEATRTSASNNESHGVSVTTANTSMFGNMLASGGNPNAGGALPSIFSSMTVSGNGGHGFNFDIGDSTPAYVVIDDAGGTRTVIDGNAGNGIDWLSGGTTLGRLEVSGTDITNVGGVVTGHGINIATTGSSLLVASVDDTRIGSLTPGGLLPGLGGNGINVATSGTSDLSLDVTNSTSFNNEGDGMTVNTSGGSDLDLTVVNTQFRSNAGAGYRGIHNGTGDFTGVFDNVHSRFNGERGFDILVRNTGVNRYDIINGSIASDNGEQGIFYATQATTDGSASISGPSPLAIPGNRNDFGSPNVVSATLNILDSTITNNGQNGTQDGDGLVLALGSNTRLVSTIAGNTFGGNLLDDVRIFPILSVNPATSTDDPDAGDPDTFVFDPTAELRLAFGIQDTNANNSLDTVNINTGDQVEVTATGNGTTWRLADNSTAAGLFTNADPFKGAPRSVNGDFDVITSNGAPLFDIDDNVFIQFAVQQDLFNEFITLGGFQSVVGPAFP